MLSRPNRLRKTHDIARVYKKGSYGAGSGLLSIKALSSGHPQSRLVVVVAKKISKRAVVRNRIRRRISGDLEARWGTVRPGYDIVISAHADIREVSTEELHRHLTKALEKARVIALAD